jgi:membrane protein
MDQKGRTDHRVAPIGQLLFAAMAIWAARRMLGYPDPAYVREDGGQSGNRNERGKQAPAEKAGRGADDPAEIPARGWMAILRRVWDEIGNDRVLAVAAGVTFYVLLAIFPAVTALVSVYGLFADTNTIQGHLNSLSMFVPASALDIIISQVQRVTSQEQAALGFATIAGLAVSIWSANAGVKALFDALNVAYGEKETRGFIELNLVSLAFTAGMILFALLAIGAAIAVPVALKLLPLGGFVETLLRWSRWPIMLLVLLLALALLYRFGPTRKKPEWKWITVGSAFASIMAIAASAAFSWYATNFAAYNETYGTLGAAIGFMTWVWITVTVIMIGAELNSEIELQAKGTVKD